MFEQWVQKPIEFEDLDELLSMDWIKERKTLDNFYRFSLSKMNNSKNYTGLLMAEYNEGKKWHVVGYLKDLVDLPEWKAVYE